MIEKKTLETARENAENALKEVQAIKDVKSREWEIAWERYKHLSDTYRSYLICAYNL